MKQGVLVDSMTRQYVEDYVGQEVQDGLEVVTDFLPDGMYEPRHVDGVWINGISQVEIDEMNKPPEIVQSVEQVELSRLKSENEELTIRLGDVEIVLADIIMGV